jgi:hypothetical protein
MLRFSRFAVVLSVSMLLMGAATNSAPSRAQGGPSVRYARTEAELKAVQGGLALMKKYGLPPTALDNLLPLLNSPDKLSQTLRGLGLSDAQIGTMLEEAVPLVRLGGLDAGALQSYVSDQARKLLTDNGVDPEVLDELLASGMTMEQIKQEFVDGGLSDEAADKIAKGVGYYEALGLDPRAHANAIARDALGLMERYGIPPQALNELLPNVTDPAKMAEILMSKYGLSADKAQAALGEAAPLIAEGLNANIPAQFIAQEALDVLFGKGLTPEQVEEVMALRGDLKAFEAALAEAGIDPKEVANIGEAFEDFQNVGIDDDALDEALQEFEAASENLDQVIEDLQAEDAAELETPDTEGDLDGEAGDDGSSGDNTADDGTPEGEDADGDASESEGGDGENTESEATPES